MNTLAALGISSAVFCVWFTWRTVRASNGENVHARRSAIIEAWAHILIGYSINFFANFLIIPLMTDGHSISVAGNFWGGWLFTAISMMRTYLIRTRLSGFIAKLAQRLS